jgi:signal transduction histidine kinase
VEEATSANQAKSNFLATISHELRTPLTTLIGYEELLADGILGPMPPPQVDVVDRMSAVTHALTTTIDEILTYSSIEAGREVARLRDASGAELLRAAHAVIEPVARQKGLWAGITLNEEPAMVCTDPDKVRQILVNLAGNGVKFTEQGGVHLSLARQNGALHFAVRDTGTGIPEEDQARLFQPFTQLDGGLTRRHGGTGLGLYISHRLAALLGGRIEVESVPGNGSTFTLVLPTS